MAAPTRLIERSIVDLPLMADPTGPVLLGPKTPLGSPGFPTAGGRGPPATCDDPGRCRPGSSPGGEEGPGQRAREGYGSRTVSMTWMIPLLALMSAARIAESFTYAVPPETDGTMLPPLSILIESDPRTVAAPLRPAVTW